MRVLALLVLLAPGLLAQGEDVKLDNRPTRWRISYDHLDVDGPDLGLLGIHYDQLGVWEGYPPLYLGLGGYAAVAGDRGGFFLGGFTVGAIWQVYPLWLFDSGVFLGAGGGGGGSGSNGWAVRPFVGLEREFGLYGLRAEVGLLDMDAFEREFFFSFGISLSGERLDARSAPAARAQRKIPRDKVVSHELRVTPRYLWMDPDSGSRKRSGKALSADISMIGIGVDYFISEYLFVPFEAYGAVGGGVSGFAMGLAGLGVSVPAFGENVRLEGKASVGAGGGGDVDTGGGLVWQVLGGLRANITRHMALEAMGGHTSFPDGELDATTVTLGISWSGHPVELAVDYPRGNLTREGLPGDDARIVGTRFYVANKLYDPASSAHKANGSDLDSTLNLLGVGVEQPLTEWLTLYGEAWAAWEGNVGGYSEGLLGAKFEWQPQDMERHHFSLNAGLGAAGGGGMDVGSGLIYEYAGGWRYDLGTSTFLTIDIGHTTAEDGSFEATAYTVGLGWYLQRAFLRD